MVNGVMIICYIVEKSILMVNNVPPIYNLNSSFSLKLYSKDCSYRCYKTSPKLPPFSKLGLWWDYCLFIYVYILTVRKKNKLEKSEVWVTKSFNYISTPIEIVKYGLLLLNHLFFLSVSAPYALTTRVLMILVVPGHIAFSFFIYFFQPNSNEITISFLSTYLLAAIIQVWFQFYYYKILDIVALSAHWRNST